MAVFFNVLITSISKKVPLIKTVRQAADHLPVLCKVFGGDLDPLCIGRFFVDEFWQMPHLSVLKIEELVRYCKKNQIRAIIPTRDGELAYFSKHKDFLLNHEIFCLISEQKSIEICCNKLLFYQYLSSFHIPAIYTTQDITSISGDSYVVKECFGAGSDSIGLNLNFIQAESWARKLKDPIFQPFVKGEEYSIDVYISHDRSLKEAIVRKRELVVNGESQITFTIQHKGMEKLCLKTAELLNIWGHAVFQVLCDAHEHLHLIECNPRFGGASTLSVAMGLRSFEWFIEECLKVPLTPFKRSSKEMQLIRFPEDKIFSL